MSFYKRRRPKPEEEKCADPAKARARALDALASREMSSAQLYERLCARFGLDDVQAQAILDMRLKALQGLDREKLQKEYDDLEEKIAALAKATEGVRKDWTAKIGADLVKAAEEDMASVR